MTVFTIGHSTRSTDELVALLREHGVRRLVDIRRYPASRRHPHFAAGPLGRALEAAGISYRHEPDMGGRRRGREDSPNTAWRSAGFRAFADHMTTPVFANALVRLEREAAEARTALLCAEAVPWRCHRQLVADLLVARGSSVLHILGRGHTAPHRLHEAARLRPDGTLVYRADEGDQIEML